MLSNVVGDVKEGSTICKSLFELDDHAEVSVVVARRRAMWGVIMRRQADTKCGGQMQVHRMTLRPAGWRKRQTWLLR